MGTERLHQILRLDGAANLLAGIGLIVTAGLLADPLGLDSGWPVAGVGLALGVYGVENLLVARRTTPTALRALIAVDLGFAVAVTAFAMVDPTAAETWMRWALVATAVLSADFGIAKFLGLRALGAPREQREGPDRARPTPRRRPSRAGSSHR